MSNHGSKSLEELLALEMQLRKPPIKSSSNGSQHLPDVVSTLPMFPPSAAAAAAAAAAASMKDSSAAAAAAFAHKMAASAGQVG